MKVNVSFVDEEEQPHDGPAPPRRHGLAARENPQPRGGGRGAKRPAAKTRGAKGGQQNMAQDLNGCFSITASAGPMNPGAAQFNMPPNAGQPGLIIKQSLSLHASGPGVNFI